MDEQRPVATTNPNPNSTPTNYTGERTRRRLLFSAVFVFSIYYYTYYICVRRSSLFLAS